MNQTPDFLSHLETKRMMVHHLTIALAHVAPIQEYLSMICPPLFGRSKILKQANGKKTDTGCSLLIGAIFSLPLPAQSMIQRQTKKATRNQPPILKVA